MVVRGESDRRVPHDLREGRWGGGGGGGRGGTQAGLSEKDIERGNIEII